MLLQGPSRIMWLSELAQLHVGREGHLTAMRRLMDYFRGTLYSLPLCPDLAGAVGTRKIGYNSPIGRGSTPRLSLPCCKCDMLMALADTGTVQ